MLRATTIYNRAGTSHLWLQSPRKGVVRSLCGLVDQLKNLDQMSAMRECRQCEKAAKSLQREGTSE